MSTFRQRLYTTSRWGWLLLIFLLGCASPSRERTLGPLQPMPDLPLQIQVDAAPETGDFGVSAARALSEKLRLDLATSGPVPVTDSSDLVLHVQLLEAHEGDATARILIGWDVARTRYRLEARLWWRDRMLDRLSIDNPLVPGSERDAKAQEILVEDAAFRLRRFIDIRRPNTRQKTVGIRVCP